MYLSFTELEIYLFLLKSESQWAGPPTWGIICKHSWAIRRMLPAFLLPWLSGTNCFTHLLRFWLFRKHIKKKIKGPMFFKQRETPAASRGISASCQEEVTWVPSTWQLQTAATLSHPCQFSQITAHVRNKGWLSMACTEAVWISNSFRKLLASAGDFLHLC